MPYRSMEVNANLTKGAAGPADVLQLLRHWRPDEETPAEFQSRAIEENLLGKSSRKRMLDLVKNVLARRYFVDATELPGRHILALVRAELPQEVVRDVLYYHAALAEHLLYRVATELLFDLREQGISGVDTLRVARWIREREAAGEVPAYSEVVLAKVAQSALTALRDFGVLEGKVKKRIAPLRVPHEVIGYVAYALRDEDLPARRIVQHPDWRLFLLNSREAEDAILEGARHRHYTYSAAGDIRRFDWHYDSLDEYVASLAAATV